MPYPGSVDVLTLTVDPFGGDTAATVALQAPDGTSSAPTATTADGGHTWSATVVYTQVGRWAATWTVTGTGAGVTQQVVQVSRLASGTAGVVWRPEPWQVAAYVPRRTLVAASDGYGNALHTFTSSTHPPLEQVNLLITDACAWVLVKTGPVDGSLVDMATATAAVWAAAQIEAGYPDNRDDLSNAQVLQARAESMRADLAAANEAITGTDPEDPTAHLLPEFAFPAPVPWGDDYL